MAQAKEHDAVPSTSTTTSSASSSPALSVRWVLGFPKQKVQFMNDRTICYPCGNFIVFLNTETKKKILLQCMNGIVGVMATNIPQQVVAFSDRKLKPLIYIYSFPELSRKMKLKGNVLLDYTILSFSYCGTYLASYSSLPEFELAIWNWKMNVILCKKTQPGTDVNQMTFNPMNWRQLCLSSTSAVTLWTIERSNQEHHLKSKAIKLPLENGTFDNETENIFPQSLPKDLIYGPVLPLSAIAGLVDKEAETFKPKDDLFSSLHPTMHCWTPSSDLYIGCEEGFILVFNGESSQVTILNMIEDSLKNRTLMAPMTMVYQKGGMLASGLDGFIYSCTIKDFNCTVEDFFEIEESLQHMIFSPNYKTLLLQTSKGCVYTYTLSEEPVLDKIIESCDDKFNSVDFLMPGNEFFLTLTPVGEVCVWNMEDASYVSRICLNTPATVLVCSPSSLSAAVGTGTGFVQFLDLRNASSLQVIHKAFLSRAPVNHLLYDQQGMYLLAGTAEGHVFVIDAHPSSRFKILGFVEVAKNILQISTVSLLETDIVEVMVTSLLPNKRTRLETFVLPRILPQVTLGLVDERGRMRKELIHAFLYEIEHTLSSAVLDYKSHRVYGFCTEVPYICSYEIPENEHVGVLILKPNQKMASRQYGSGTLFLSPHGLWLISVAKCGVLCVRDILTLGTFVRYRSHSHQARGIHSIKVSTDGQNILVIGKTDGTLVHLRWRRLGGNLVSEGHDYCRKLLKSLKIITENENIFLDMSPDESSDSLEEMSRNASSTESSQEEEHFQFENTKQMPWLEKKSQEAIQKEVKLYSSKRKEIKKGIKALTKAVQEMMEENDTLENISKLEQKEFALDLEELENLHHQSGEEVSKIRKDVEMCNLTKRYLSELIKEECWNSMAVKGRSLKCFHIPCVVENFPMKARTEEELAELNRVIHQKKIENECLKIREEIIETQNTVTLVKKLQEDEDEEEEEEKIKIRDFNLPNYLLGSLCTDFGIDISLLSNQLELHSKEEKINQIILLKDIIYQVKTAFNREFDTAYKQKEFEIVRVKKKNVRIQEIILDLELDESVWTPSFDDTEKPERTLVVHESEIAVHRHINPWHRTKAELAAAQEIEHRLQNPASDTRHRALMDMMGGVLEVKKEDILKMVIPQPDFMLKPDVLWSEEERKQYKEYEKKVKDLNEERDKYKKSLDAELKKLQNAIQESTQHFDENLKRLFDRRVRAEMVVNQEELKINHLLFSLLLDEEICSREEYLNNYLSRKHEEKSQSSEAILKAKEDLDMYKEQYDNLVAEDKVLERSFKKEFPDVSSHHIEILSKLFRRRPRVHKLKPQQEVTTNNPFGDRPGSAKLVQEAFALLMRAMDELDSPNNMPEGLEPTVWSHFCTTRRTKVENEQKVKQKAAGLVEMTAFLRRRTEEDEKVQQDIEKVFHELILLQDEKVKYQLNLTVQILLKQGQIELENFQFLMEYSDAILINKNIIEELNSVIRTQGQKKVASMMESKACHKGIFQIEWEHKKMEMEMEDLNQKAWDIQMLFFSRDRQRFLNEPNYDLLIAYQIGIMEQTINALDKTHKKNVENCKKILKKLGKFSNKKDIANYHLSCNLREELVAVSERKDICNAMGASLTCEKIAKERYKNLILQQKLTHISREQAEQISVLQAEVERLRMKTFPALMQM